MSLTYTETVAKDGFTDYLVTSVKFGESALRQAGSTPHLADEKGEVDLPTAFKLSHYCGFTIFTNWC